MDRPVQQGSIGAQSRKTCVCHPTSFRRHLPSCGLTENLEGIEEVQGLGQHPGRDPASSTQRASLTSTRLAQGHGLSALGRGLPSSGDKMARLRGEDLRLTCAQQATARLSPDGRRLQLLLSGADLRGRRNSQRARRASSRGGSRSRGARTPATLAPNTAAELVQPPQCLGRGRRRLAQATRRIFFAPLPEACARPRRASGVHVPELLPN